MCGTGAAVGAGHLATVKSVVGSGASVIQEGPGKGIEPGGGGGNNVTGVVGRDTTVELERGEKKMSEKRTDSADIAGGW